MNATGGMLPFDHTVDYFIFIVQSSGLHVENCVDQSFPIVDILQNTPSL